MTKKTEIPEIQELEFLGTPIKIGKNTFIMPPLPITKKHKMGFYSIQDEVTKAREALDYKTIGELTLKSLEFIYEALKMNYPEITRDQSIDLLTERDLKRITPYLIDIKEGLEELKNEQ